LDGSGLGAVEVEGLEAASDDLGKLVDGAIEQTGDVEEKKGQVGAQGDDEFHEAIVRASLGGDLGAAPVLGEVGDGEEDRIGKDVGGIAVECGVNGLIFVGEPFSGGGEDIGGDSAKRKRFKALNNGGVPGEATGDKEGASVDGADIDGSTAGMGEGLDRARDVERDAEVAGKAVSATGGDHAQSDGGMDEYAADAVDHAVAARDEDGVDSVVKGVCGLETAVGDIVAELIGHIGVASTEVFFDETPEGIKGGSDAGFGVDQYANFTKGFRWTP